MNEAMNLTYGDLIIVEFALISYLKDFDLSMQAGIYVSELLGKVEYQLAEIKKTSQIQAVTPIPAEK